MESLVTSALSSYFIPLVPRALGKLKVVYRLPELVLQCLSIRIISAYNVIIANVEMLLIVIPA